MYAGQITWEIRASFQSVRGPPINNHNLVEIVIMQIKNGRLDWHDALLANIHSQIQQHVHSLTITIEKLIQLTPLVQYLFYLVQDTVDTIGTIFL